MNTTIYKILTADQWAELQAKESTDGAPIDIADGYVHFSTAQQVQETAEKYFSEQHGLILAAFHSDELGENLKWEPSRGGDLFPHLYAQLEINKMIWSKPLNWVNGKHVFPPL